MKPFLITGCASSGMAYTAKLLTAAGVPCTHEGLLSLEGSRRVAADGWDATFILFGGESSWLAAPLLDKLPEDINVFHQLRNPLHVIRSLMRRRFFRPDRGTGSRYTEYAKKWMSEKQTTYPGAAVDAWEDIEEHDQAIVQCMKYWVRWNQFVLFRLGEPSAAGFTYRVEDLSTGQLVLPRMLKMITGSWVPPSTDLFGHVPVGVNHASVETDAEADAISWDDLPTGRTKRYLEQMASAWGYGEKDLV